MFMSLHDLLVSTYGLKSMSNVSSVESLAMFLYIVGGPHHSLMLKTGFQGLYGQFT
jgi:hypothetical protein